MATLHLYHLSGLSTDTKPILEDALTGSTFEELDTQILFVYSRNSKSWIKSKEPQPKPSDDKPLVGPQTCIGIKKIEKTATDGLIDTYTIEYTNGTNQQFTVVNSPKILSVNQELEAEPLQDNKLYNLELSVSTDNPDETKIFDIYQPLVLDAAEINDVITSDSLATNTYWPRINEGKFILHLENYDILFTYLGIFDSTKDTWLGYRLDQNNAFIPYIGQFFADNNETYYFRAEKQPAIDVPAIKRLIEAEEARAEQEEQRLTEDLALHRLNTNNPHLTTILQTTDHNLVGDEDEPGSIIYEAKKNIYLQNVVNTGDSAVPEQYGTEKFTTGGAYELQVGSQEALDQEIVRAEAAEQTLQDNIDAEQSRAETAEGILQNNIDTEETRAITAETAIDEKLDQEIQDRIDDVNAEEIRANRVEAELQNSLQEEISRATDAEATLATNINQVDNKLNNEIDRSIEADNTLTEALDTESTRAIVAETILEDKIETEISAEANTRADEDNRLNNKLNIEQETRYAKDNELQNNLNIESQNRIDADNTLQENLDTEITRAITNETILEDKIDAEIARAINKDATLAENISSLDSKLDEEVDTLTSRISTEEARAADRENEIENSLTTTISDEIDRATTAENNIQEALDNEITRAIVNETILEEKIEAEEVRATEAESSLNSKINNLDLATVGEAGKYIKLINQTNGKVSATSENFDTDFNTVTNNTAPTTKAVKTYADAIDTKLNNSVKLQPTGNEFSYTHDNVTITSNYKNLQTGTIVTVTENVKLANENKAGMMSPADYQQIRSNTSRIENLEGQTTRLIYTDSQNPTQQDIQDFVDAYLLTKGITNPQPEDYTGIAVVVQGTYHIWHYYANDDIGWKDDGQDTVSQFTNDVAGIIKGKQEDGFVFAENNGTGSVYGWGDLKSRVSNVETGTVTDVTYDSLTKALTKTINNEPTTIVNTTTLKQDMELAAVVNTGDTNQAIENDTRKFTSGGAYNLKTTLKGEISDVEGDLTTHVNNTNNPHSVTKSQVGLGNVTNDKQIKGLASGTTPGHILVFDVDGYTVKDSGKSLNDTGKIDTISIKGIDIPADAHKNIDLPTVRTDTNEQNLSPSQKENAKTNLDLNNVDNTSDADKPISTSTQNALDLKVDKASVGYIEISGNGGTLTNDQYNETLKPYCVIKRGYEFWYKDLEDSNSISFKLTVLGLNNVTAVKQLLKDESLWITKSTKGWTYGYFDKTFYTDEGTDALLATKLALTKVATIETSTTASKAYAVGDLLIYNEVIYRVINAIASGETITAGTNVVAKTIEELLALKVNYTDLEEITTTEINALFS